jgi:hypothetical protein
VDLVAAVGADEQPLVVVEPSERALDDPAGATEAGAVRGRAACGLGRDPPLSNGSGGIPVASTKRWCLEPFLALSTGLGPVAAPPFSLARG